MVDPALLISVLAVAISLVSLWKTHLAPFNLKVTNSPPQLSIYKITPMRSGKNISSLGWISDQILGKDESKNVWWIPSFDVGLTLQNVGQKSGEIKNIRAVGRFRGEEGVVYPFSAQFVVDPMKFQSTSHKRFSWISKAIIHNWYPVTIPGDDEKHLHLVLEGSRWDDKKTGMMDLTLEIITSETEDPVVIEEYEVDIFDNLYDGDTIVASEKGAVSEYEQSEEKIGWLEDTEYP